MDDTDIDRLDADLTALEQSLGDAAAMTASFDEQLRGVQAALGDTARDLGHLERGFSRGLRRAFDGVVLDGQKLTDALGTVARAMADTVYGAAVSPVTDHLGGLLAQGVNAAVGSVLPNATGNAFSQGRVMPFAKGGVVSSATTFPMRGGTGLMGEAGPEAIMPLSRGPDGRLGVQSAGAGHVSVTMNISTPDAASFQRSQSQIASQMARALGRANRNR